MPKNKENYKNIEYAKKMPRLKHKISKNFDTEKSEVICWLVNQPELVSYLFDTARRKGCIVYDNATGEWHGSETE